MPFSTTYHPAVQDLKNKLMANCSLIENQPLLKTILKQPPIISYKRGKSLKDMLLTAKMNLKAVDNVTQPQKPHWKPVQVCLWFPSKSSVTKIRKTALFLPKKPKNQMVKNGKTGNRNGQQNRENEVFQCKNRKTDPQNGQNWKTENPNAPLLYLRTNEVFLCFLPFVFLSSFVPTSLFFSFTSPTIFTGPYFEDETVQWKMYQLVTIVIKFKSISKRLLNVQSTPDNSNPR